MPSKRRPNARRREPVAPPTRRALRRRLLAWFRKGHRDLPWRRTRDPYAIWVSEVMLQQTQVPTALPYYRRFLRRFPTVRTLAGATDEEVLKVWQGLGYYRRAMNLRAAAREVVRRHGGRVPADPAAFAALPGVGRYTCGAVQSIAFGHALAALDGNAARVLARWFAVTAPVTSAATQRRLWSLAEALVSIPGGVPRPGTTGRSAATPCRNDPGVWNQAVMEFGSRLCTPRAPRCPVCPVRTLCLARKRGIEGRLPVKRKRKRVPHIEVGAGIIWRRGKVLLCKRRADAMLGGLWEFPGGKRRPGESIPECIRRELREECGITVTVGRHLVDVTHTYSHLRVTLRCYHCRADRGRVRLLGCDGARWVRPERIADFPLPAADVRILEALGIDRRTARRAARGR